MRNEVSGLLHLYAPEEVIDACYSELEARYRLCARIGESAGIREIAAGLEIKPIENLAEDLRYKQALLFRLLRKDIMGEDINVSKLENMDALFSLSHEIYVPTLEGKGEQQ